MSEDRRGRWQRGAGSVAAICGTLALWWCVAQLRFGGRPLVAPPVATLVAILRDPSLLGADLLATLGRSGLGFALGVVAGVVVGLAASAVLRRAPIVEPILDAVRSVPPVALLPVFLLALGWSERARVATIAAGCIWVMALSVTTAARAPRSGRRELLDLAGAGRLEALRWTEPWESLPTLVVGLRSAASTAIVVAVVTEMVAGAERGIGSRVVMAQVAGDPVELTAELVAIGAAGYLVNLSLRILEERVRLRAGRGGA